MKDQKENYSMYEQFEAKAVYCNYYRVKIEAFLPPELQIKNGDRFFVYRTPSGYNQEFIKHDLAILLNNDQVNYSKDVDVKPFHPLSSKIRA